MKQVIQLLFVAYNPEQPDMCNQSSGFCRAPGYL
jgi:hypothetical protein